MIFELLRKKKELTFERSYAAPIGDVWDAWTRAELLRQWWGPEHTTIAECEVDLRVGGRISIVMEAGEGMDKYQGTRWPLEGTFTHIEPQRRLTYEARSWTEGEADTTTIVHVNELELSEDGNETVVNLRIAIHAIGSGARMAAFGMKWGYKAQLDELDAFLTGWLPRPRSSDARENDDT
jgi:uncharacterized protein YndB with AHSA1/START domain